MSLGNFRVKIPSAYLCRLSSNVERDFGKIKVAMSKSQAAPIYASEVLVGLGTSFIS